MPYKGFAIWVTGLPASGKTTLARAVEKRLYQWYGVKVVRLESDELRKILTPHPTYSVEERDWFYNVLVFMGELLTKNGINVIFDATGNRRAYREKARRLIKKFMEVYTKCSLDVCKQRDVKGIYERALRGLATTVPGIQEPYEEPEAPELIINTETTTPEEGAEHVIAKLKEQGWI